MKAAEAFLAFAALLLTSAVAAAAPTGAVALASARRAAARKAGATAAAFVSKDEEPKKYPVTKVVTLLRDMQAQLQKEADSDEELYDKLMCWCETNDRDKTQAIQDAETKVGQLTTTIETTAADSAKLKQEITNHEQDLATSKASLDQATALREKQLAEFTAEEKDMLQSIQALKDAIIVLSKHHQTSLLDQGIMDAVKYQLQRHQDLLRASITPHQRRLVLALGQQPAFRQTYQPQSGEVFGILRQMKETFESNLADSQKEEMSNKKSYEELKAAKEAEIAATQEAIDKKKTHLAQADESNAQAKQELEDIQNALTIDDQFLMEVKAHCAATRAEYERRTKMRGEELQAVSEAVKILTEDQARDTFSKVMNTASLLQRRQRRSGDNRRDQASAVLAAAAAKAGNARLSALAAAARLDPMTRVKAAIDQLVTELLQEKQEEITKRDSCIERQNENERITETYQRDKADLESKMEGLKMTISDSQTDLETLTKDISNIQLEIKMKGEDREAKNKEFQSMVNDQREMQELLAKAVAVLKRVYKTQEVHADSGASAASLVQAHRRLAAAQSQTPPPIPEGFAAYGSNRASGGVIGMLEQISSEAKAMETEAIRDEQEEQSSYAKFVKDMNASIRAKQQQIVNLSTVKADSEQALIATEEDLKSKTDELETLASTASAIKMDCDFLVRNFDIRQEARDQEVQALREAKAFLSGMLTDE